MRLAIWGLIGSLMLTLAMGAVPAGAAEATADADAQTGRILCAYWRDQPGAKVSDLTGQAAYPDYPDEQVMLDRLEIPENQPGNFGTRIRGFVHPPRDGAYRFYIAGNNQCELWFSEDEDPGHAKKIAGVEEWSAPRAWKATAGQQSAEVMLRGGGRYYIEVRHKNGGGDNHVSVAWELPGGEFEGPIPGRWLSAAKPVVVPGPTVKVENWPATAGMHRVWAEVEYHAQKLRVPVLLTLPKGAAAGGGRRGMVFLGDTEKPAEADGFAIQGPDRRTAAGLGIPGAEGAEGTKGAIVVSPQCPAEGSYDERMTMKALCAVVEEMVGHYQVDRGHLGLSGCGTGGAGVWLMALEMPGFFKAVQPVGGGEVRHAELAEKLRGVRVRIYTDIADGFSTEAANRMKAVLAANEPKAEVVYLGEKELGKASAADYCYASESFYRSLLSDEAPVPATPKAGESKGRWLRAVIAAVLVLGLLWNWRRANRARER